MEGAAQWVSVVERGTYEAVHQQERRHRKRHR